MKLSIILDRAEIISRAKKHLSVVAKRAKDREGRNIFSEVTTSQTEDCIYEDMVKDGASDLVAKLKDMCDAYVFDDGDALRFDLYSDRWRIEKTPIEIEDGDDKPTMDLTEVLKSAVTSYVYNFTIARYLNSVAPAIGRFSDPYMENCETVFKQVCELAFVRRGIRVPEYPYTKSITTYGDIVNMTVGQKETVSYSIDYGKKDDIKVTFMPPIVRLWRHVPGGVEIIAHRSGKCCMVLSSRHDSDVFKHLELFIEEREVPEQEEDEEVIDDTEEITEENTEEENNG